MSLVFISMQQGQAHCHSIIFSSGWSMFNIKYPVYCLLLLKLQDGSSIEYRNKWTTKHIWWTMLQDLFRSKARTTPSKILHPLHVHLEIVDHISHRWGHGQVEEPPQSIYYFHPLVMWRLSRSLRIEGICTMETKTSSPGSWWYSGHGQNLDWLVGKEYLPFEGMMTSLIQKIIWRIRRFRILFLTYDGLLLFLIHAPITSSWPYNSIMVE